MSSVFSNVKGKIARYFDSPDGGADASKIAKKSRQRKQEKMTHLTQRPDHFFANSCVPFYSVSNFSEPEEDLSVMGFPPAEERSGPEGAETGDDESNAAAPHQQAQDGDSAQPAHDPDEGGGGVEGEETEGDDEEEARQRVEDVGDEEEEEECEFLNVCKEERLVNVASPRRQHASHHHV